MDNSLYSNFNLDPARLTELLETCDFTSVRGRVDNRPELLETCELPTMPGSVREPPEKYLIDAVKQRDSTVSYVDVNDSKTIHIAADQNHTLFTSGLGGCTAALIVSQKQDGSSVASMTHFDPLSLKLHSSVVGSEVFRHHKDLPGATKHSVLVVSPGDWVDVGGRYELQVIDVSKTNSLVESVRKSFGEREVEVKLCPYGIFSRGVDDSSAFIVRFYADESVKTSYQALGTHFGSLPFEG